MRGPDHVANFIAETVVWCIHTSSSVITSWDGRGQRCDDQALLDGGVLTRHVRPSLQQVVCIADECTALATLQGVVRSPTTEALVVEHEVTLSILTQTSKLSR